MKKSLVLALSLAAPVFAGEATLAPAPIVTPAPAPCCPISVEVAGVYGIATGDILDGLWSKDIDVYGGDLTLVYKVNDNHSFNLRGGYTFGDECARWTETGATGALVGAREEIDVHTFTIMPGYRYTHAINEKWSVFAGANIGISNVSVKECFDTNEAGVANRQKGHDSDWGLAYSVELGTSYKIAENVSIFATYGFFGSTADPVVDGLPVDNQNYHGPRIGVSLEF